MSALTTAGMASSMIGATSPISASSFLSGASSLGSLASSFGIGGSKKKAPEYSSYLKAYFGPGNFKNGYNTIAKMEEHQITNSINAKMKSAKQHGLSPLTMLGVPTSTGGAQAYVGGETNAPDISEMGQGIDRALNAGRLSTQRKLDQLQLEKLQLENDYIRTQIAGSQKAIANTSATTPIHSDRVANSNNGNVSSNGAISGTDLVDIVKDEQITKNPNESAQTAGQHAAFMKIDVGGGRTVEVPYSQEGWAESLGEMPIPYKYGKTAEILIKRAMGLIDKRNTNKYKPTSSKQFKQKYPQLYKK